MLKYIRAQLWRELFQAKKLGLKSDIMVTNIH